MLTISKSGLIMFSRFRFLKYYRILLDVINEAEEAVPTDAGEASTVWVRREPDEDWLAHDMVFRNEAPIA